MRLVTWEGSPLVGKAVKFFIPDRPATTVTTDALGLADAGQFHHDTAGVHEFSAEVLLEQGVKYSVRVLVDVK